MGVPRRHCEGFCAAVTVECLSRLNTRKENDARMITELVRIWKLVVMD
jgi:hypothetical protein